MDFIETALWNLMNGGKRTITDPIFIKDFSNDNQQMNDLIELSGRVITPDKKDLIERDIDFLKIGMKGEADVYFELKNSFIPMLCLHDVRLEYNDYIAQFDYIVITKKFICILETKKLSGDIEITPDGDFVRIIKNRSGKFIKKEGMYSPIAQNERHARILREILVKEKLIKTFPIKSLVVLANPKTILNKKQCPKAIQDNVYKHDQLATFLNREIEDKTNDRDNLEKYLYEIADYLIKNHKPQQYDYVKKYSLSNGDFIAGEGTAEAAVTYDAGIDAGIDARLNESLRQYRLNACREENIKAYVIFNNQELEQLVSVRPRTMDELKQIKGFGEWKIQKYGEKILAIIAEVDQKKNVVTNMNQSKMTVAEPEKTSSQKDETKPAGQEEKNIHYW